jgi:hypothetical protein
MAEGQTPRRSWLAVVFAVLAPIFYGVLLLGGAGVMLVASRKTWMIFQGAGWFAWLELMTAMLGLVVLIALGVLVTLKQGAWSWPLALPSFFVSLVAAVGLQLTMAKVRGAIAGESVDPAQKARIFAEGFSESLGLLIVGGLLASILLSAASMAVAARALSRVGRRQIGGPPFAAFGLGLLTFAIVTIVRVVVSKGAAGPPLEAVAALTGCIAPAIAATAMWGDPEDRDGHTRAAGDLVVAALLAVAGVLVAGVAVRSLGLSMAFGALSGEGIDPAQAARIMAEGMSEAKAASLWGTLYVLPALVAGLVALLMRTGHAFRGIGRAWGAVVGVLVMGALAVLMQRLQSDRIQATVPEMFKTNVPVIAQLVNAPPDADLPPAGGSIVFVTADAVVIGNSSVGPASQLDTDKGAAALVSEALMRSSRYSTPQFAVDPSTSYARMWRLATAWNKATQDARMDRVVRWIAKGSAPKAALPPPFDGMDAGLVAIEAKLGSSGAPAAGMQLQMTPAQWSLRSPGVEPVLKQGSLADRRAWLASKNAGALYVSADPAVVAAEVLLVLASSRGSTLLAPATEAPAPTAAPTDAAAPAEGADDGKRVKTGQVTVTGLLATEVVKRVVKQNMPKIQACYEQGLARNPKLAGKLTARIIINDEGRVTTSGNGGTDLGNQQVVSCVLEAFYKMQFPKPVKGVVMVVYPLTFSP